MLVKLSVGNSTESGNQLKTVLTCLFRDSVDLPTDSLFIFVVERVTFLDFSK